MGLDGAPRVERLETGTVQKGEVSHVEKGHDLTSCK